MRNRQIIIFNSFIILNYINNACIYTYFYKIIKNSKKIIAL